MIEQNFRNFLLQNNAIKAIVGSSVYPTTVPQKSRFPAITMPVRSKDADIDQQGNTHNNITTFTLLVHYVGDVEDKTYFACKSLVEIVKDQINGFRGQMGTSFIYSAVTGTESDLPFNYFEGGKNGGSQSVQIEVILQHS